MKILRWMTFSGILLLMQMNLKAQNWQLVWQDEFTNGIGPDWVFETGNGGWGNNELQYYRSQNATVQNGNLVITAKQENFGGSNYTSARMKTQGRKSFKYGRIEARMALPSGQGLWPAFWMLGSNITSVGWPACGEIDIMEHVNTAPEVHGTIHWRDHNGDYANYGGYTNTNVGAYHVYSVEWNQNAIRWFIDGQQYHVVDISNGVNGTSEFQNNFFILLNLAVGGNWPGFSIDNGALPAQMLVDYVRVYQGGGSNPNPSFNLVTQAENYSNMNGVQIEATSDAGGGQNVGYIDSGDWMAYNGITIPSSGYYTVNYRVASVNGGQLSLDVNSGSTVLGNVSIPATGGWQNWTTVSHTVYISAGTYNFGIFAQTGGWNINWWQITRQSNAATIASSETLNSSSSSAELTQAMVINVYPNPAEDILNVKLPEGFSGDATSVKVINSAGKVMLKGKLSSGQLNISKLPQGLYTLQAVKGEEVVSQRFIKK